MALDISLFPQSLAVKEMGRLNDELIQLQDNAEVKVSSSQTSVALNMADDLSALLSSMLQNRRTDRNTELSNEERLKYAEILEAKKPQSTSKVLMYAKDAGMTSKTMLFLLRQMFNDVVDIALLLQALIQKKKKKNSDIDQELSDVSLDLLEQTYDLLLAGPEKRKIKSSMNIQTQVNAYSPRLLLSAENLRGFYQEFITDDSEPIDVYQHLTEYVGFDKRALAIEYLINSLHADINSHDPSCSSIEFGNLLDKSFTLNIIRSADELFMKGMKSIKILDATWESSRNVVFDFFIKLISNPEECKDITAVFINRCLQYHSKFDKIEFLHIVQKVVRSLPLFVFSKTFYDGNDLKIALEFDLSNVMSVFNEATTIGPRYE